MLKKIFQRRRRVCICCGSTTRYEVIARHRKREGFTFRETSSITPACQRCWDWVFEPSYHAQGADARFRLAS